MSLFSIGAGVGGATAQSSAPDAAPATAMTPQRFNFSQTGPRTYSGKGPLEYNAMFLRHATDNAASDNRSFQLYLQSLVGGSNQVGPFIDLFVNVNHDADSASRGDHIAIVGQTYSSAADTSGGELYGANSVSICHGCSAVGVDGLESDTQISDGGTAKRRTGIRSINQGSSQGATLDTAYAVGSTNGGGSFQHLMSLTRQFGAPALNAGGDFFYSDAAATIGSFADLPNVTVTHNIMDFPNYQVTGAGTVNLAAGRSIAASLAPSAANGAVLSGNGASNDIEIRNSAGTAVMQVGHASGVVNFAGIVMTGKAYSGTGGSAIPSCMPGIAGGFALVSDGKASPAGGSAYEAGDGAANEPVWCNGSRWVYLL